MSDPRGPLNRPYQPAPAAGPGAGPPAAGPVPRPAGPRAAGLPAPAPMRPPAPPVRPPAVPPAAASPAAAPRPAGPLAADEGDFDDEEDLPAMLIDRIRSLPPALVILTGGSIGSLIFLILAVTSHTTPVAVLMSAGVVTGLIFGLDSVITAIAMWRAHEYSLIRALILALIAGVSCVISFAAFAGVLVLALLLS